MYITQQIVHNPERDDLAARAAYIAAHGSIRPAIRRAREFAEGCKALGGWSMATGTLFYTAVGELYRAGFSFDRAMGRVQRWVGYFDK